MIPSITINLANLTLNQQTRAAIAGSLETKLIIVRPDLNLGKIPEDGMNIAFQVTYAPATDLPPSIVKLPFGMRERRNRTFVPEIPPPPASPPALTTVTIMVHVEKYARSGELVVMTGPSGPGDWMEKTSSGWIEVMP
jgi:hypothetical protein